jgi:hypothetical protein
VAVLVLETPASPTPPAEVETRIAAYGGPVQLVAIPDAEAATVAGALTDAWLGRP